MKVLLIGVGAAGNKAAEEAVSMGIVNQEDVIMVNSTSKDFPVSFKGQQIVLSDKDTGCGKERSVAKDYALRAIKSGKMNIETNGYTAVVFCTSIEGGTGSGATPVLAKFISQVYRKNVHIIAFAGFQDDARGLRNSVQFFQDIDSMFVVQTIKNSSFLKAAGGNRMKAEVLANKEMCRRIQIMTGETLVASTQNIDDTDILKVSNTSGYMTVEYSEVKETLLDQDDFNKHIKRMIHTSASIASENPGAARIGVILNIDPASEDAVDYSFKAIKDAYGNPYECYLQKQWDDEYPAYIAFIVSGMQMPLDAIESIYETYKNEVESVNKATDNFYDSVSKLAIDEDDSKFDMIQPKSSGTSVEEFMKQYETN